MGLSFWSRSLYIRSSLLELDEVVVPDTMVVMVGAMASQALVVTQEVAVLVNTIEPELFEPDMVGKYEVEREMVSVHMGTAV